MARDLDVILFGATGFTGKHTVPFVSKFCKIKNLSWGIAGRSEKKLKDVLTQCEKETGTSFGDIPVIIADVQDEKSLKEMARKCRIVINCTGPYRFYGEPVVKACVEEGTHHVDVSGEPQYMEGMQFKYDEEAKKKGIYIISACGFDSIPADLGVAFLQKKFDGTLNSVVIYMETWMEGDHGDGSLINYGTWESLINGFAYSKELGALRRKWFPNRLPSFKPKLEQIGRPHKSELVEGWALPFPGADRSVMKRTQRLLYEKDEKRPIQIEPYFTLKTFWNLVTMIIFGLMLQLLAKFQYGRDLLLKYPEKFTAGMISNDDPDEEKINNNHFRFTFYGEGWKEKLPTANDEYTTPPNKAICAKIQGKNPGYGATCVSLTLAAIIILTELEKLPPGGGIYPPGYAFAKTSMIDQLNENGLTFEIEYEKDLSA